MIIFALCGYFVLMLLVGIVAGRRVKNQDDYLVAGRKLSYSLAIPTIVATWFGAGTCLGVSGNVYKEGFRSVIADPFGCCLALLIAATFFVGKLRRKRYTTIADLIRESYGQRLEAFASILMVPFNIGTLAAQLVAFGYIFSLFVTMPPLYGVCLGAFVVMAYTSFGGMWAVTMTDFVQFILIVLGLLILIPLTVSSIPNSTDFFSAFGQECLTLLPQDNSWDSSLTYLGQWMLTGLGALMGQDLLQRVFSCKSEKVAVRCTYCSAAIYLVLGFIPLAIGLSGRLAFPGFEQPEMLIPHLAKQHFSPVVLSLFLIGLLSAIMSTADSYLLAGTSLLTQNVLPSLWRKGQLSLSHIRQINLVMIICALVMALVLPNIFDLMVHSGATLFVAIFVPVTAALYWDRAHVVAAWSSMLFGIFAWIGYLLFHFSALMSSHEEILYQAAMIGFFASFCAYFLPYLLLPSLRPSRKDPAIVN